MTELGVRNLDEIVSVFARGLNAECTNKDGIYHCVFAYGTTIKFNPHGVAKLMEFPSEPYFEMGILADCVEYSEIRRINQEQLDILIGKHSDYAEVIRKSYNKIINIQLRPNSTRAELHLGPAPNDNILIASLFLEAESDTVFTLSYLRNKRRAVLMREYDHINPILRYIITPNLDVIKL